MFDDPALTAAADQSFADVEHKLRETIDRWRSGELVNDIVRPEAQNDRVLRVGALAAWLYIAQEPANVACLLAAAVDQLAANTKPASSGQ
jgi:hypothetical protein